MMELQQAQLQMQWTQWTGTRWTQWTESRMCDRAAAGELLEQSDHKECQHAVQSNGMCTGYLCSCFCCTL